MFCYFLYFYGLSNPLSFAIAWTQTFVIYISKSQIAPGTVEKMYLVYVTSYGIFMHRVFNDSCIFGLYVHKPKQSEAFSSIDLKYMFVLKKWWEIILSDLLLHRSYCCTFQVHSNLSVPWVDILLKSIHGVCTDCTFVFSGKLKSLTLASAHCTKLKMALLGLGKLRMLLMRSIFF